MRIAIFGATKGMGRALARRLAERGDRLVLLGRDEEGLERSARDLEVRGGGEEGSVGTAPCDLLRPETFAPALEAAEGRLERLDAVVVTAAAFGTQEDLEADPERLRRLLEANVTGTVLFCEEAHRRLLASVPKGGAGRLCVFSSVAGDRPRKPVVLYGTTKAALSYYLEGLDLRHRKDGLRVVLVKPGFVKTSMTEGLEPPPFAGEPEQVARDVERALDRGRLVVYTPKPWRWVMRVVRSLPRFVMRRVGF
ncbi:MAG: SDR family NAD(P)-dependent oxidoreductase [Thermoanaerobaculia bacterium]